MGGTVFANGMEVSGKASSHQVIASMPDVCLSPPSPPAGPVPIPYPNFAQASDTTGGSKKVKIGGKEVGMKGQSSYKKSKGDEAATRSFGAGVLSHTISGAVKHKAGSFDVKVEGANAVRFGDLTTGNHQNPGNGCMVPDYGGLAMANPDDVDCEALSNANEQARKDMQGDSRKTVQRVGNPTNNCTITHAKYTNPGGISGIMKGCSRAVVGKYDNGFAEGLSKVEKNAQRGADGKVKSKSCGDHVYKRADVRPHTSHTEARIIEDIFRSNPNGGGSLLLSIDWPNPPPGKDSKSPCDDCKKLICAIAAVPGCLDIKICDGDDDAKPPPCP